MSPRSCPWSDAEAGSGLAWPSTACTRPLLFRVLEMDCPLLVAFSQKLLVQSQETEIESWSLREWAACCGICLVLSSFVYVSGVQCDVLLNASLLHDSNSVVGVFITLNFHHFFMTMNVVLKSKLYGSWEKRDCAKTEESWGTAWEVG